VADEEKKDESAEAEKGAPMGGKKRMIIIGAIIAVQIPLVVLVGNKVIKPKIVPPDTTTVVVEPESRGLIMMLEDITVNLVSARRSRFLRISIGLEVEDETVMAEVEERLPEIRDAVINSVSGRKVDDLISIQGKELLKTELKERIDGKLQAGNVLKVYFSDFVVQ